MLTAACLDEPDCYQLHNDYVGFTFRVIGTGQGDSVFIRKIGDSIINEAITSFNRRLNYFQQEGLLFFESSGIESNMLDTLSFDYSVRNQYISEECGSSFNMSDLRILNHTFDSARVVSSTPSKGGGTHIEIYRCPETDTVAITFSELFATTNGLVVSNPQNRYVSKPFDSIRFQDRKIQNSVRAATVKLPVDMYKLQTRYVFFREERRDTIELSYILTTETRYQACGEQTFASNLLIQKNTFDSLSFGLGPNDEPIRNVQDPQNESFRVFDCPPTNLMTIAFRTAAYAAARTVKIKSITRDGEAEALSGPQELNAIVVPVDMNTNESTFRITYDDNTTDVFTVRYSKSSIRFFEACPDPILTDLVEATDVPNVRIVQGGNVLQYPSQTNVQISPR